MDLIREKRESRPTANLESLTTYMLLGNMLKRVKPVTENDVDSELEKLAVAVEVLTPDGRQLSIAEDHYRTLQQLFHAMYLESCRYASAFGVHSPYSTGEFDDDDD